MSACSARTGASLRSGLDPIATFFLPILGDRSFVRVVGVEGGSEGATKAAALVFWFPIGD